MTNPAKLHFLPWLRRGLARALAGDADERGVPTTALGNIEAAVSVGATEITRLVKVRGPEAVIGLNAAQIVREEPKPGSTDFETNYFPFVELLSPDLPWQFTPAAPNRDKLIPWLVLIVVEERDGIAYASVAKGPLPVLSIADGASRELPQLEEAWAWAHVQSSTPLGGGVDRAFRGRPEAFVARLMCPRVLKVDTWYRACLVPSFELGRQAGLGLSASAHATQLAWTSSTEAIELPVFHSWRFRTGREPGDFESLVKRLRAHTLADDVGAHALNIGRPGSERLPDRPNVVVDWQGALVSPNLELRTWAAGHRAAFESGLQAMLDESLLAEKPADALAQRADYDALRDDPVVAPPAYGAFAIEADAIPDAGDKPKWLREVNVDPTLRSTAGLGAEVVRRNQEQLVAAAWEQAGAMREANRALNQARLALEVGKRLKARVDALDPGARLQLTRGAHARLKRPGTDKTLLGRTQESPLPRGLISGGLRRRVRPGTTIGKAVTRENGTITFAAKLTQDFIANPAAKLAYAQPTVPYGTVMGEEVAGPKPGADLIAELQEHVALADFGLVASAELNEASVADRPGLSIEGRTSLAQSSSLRRRRATLSKREATVAMVQATEQRFVAAMRMVSSVPLAVDPGGATALPLTELANLVSEQLDPAALLRARVRSLIQPPELLGDADMPAALTFSPAYADPLYERLVEIDPELLLPGVGTIPNDSVSLARLNGRFVEAFLLGANHELGREFAWRELPVDPADTWLRSFWASLEAGVDDIERVAQWRPSKLGTHAPEGGIDPNKVLVLILKGDLLRRYPNTLIYAVPAMWEQDTDEASGEAVWERIEDGSKQRVWPRFVGTLGDGVIFLGFEFEVADVDAEVSGSSERGDGRPGWFFAFEQPPTEPRFGLDVGQPNRTGTNFQFWKNVSWYRAMGSAEWSLTHVPIDVLAGQTKPIDASDEDREDENDFEETWGRNAAAMAAITLQRPVRMLVHADQMLRPEAKG